MTTPTLPPFHQKKFPHAKSATFAKVCSVLKNNPWRLYPDSVGPWRPLRGPSAFTLVELLAVITIIGILAGLTLGAAGAVRRHSSASRAKAEISALQAACERYFAEQNAYPANTATDPNTVFDPKAYEPKSSQPNVAVLFVNLFGASNLASAPSSKRYFEPKTNMVSSNSVGTFFMDPWGNAYGYYSDGTNAPLIWSTARALNKDGTNKWITSWPKM